MEHRRPSWKILPPIEDSHTSISADASLLLTFSSSLRHRQENKETSPPPNPDDPSDSNSTKSLDPRNRNTARAPSWYDKPLGDIPIADPLDPSNMSYSDHLQESHLRRSLEESLRADGWIPQNERAGAGHCTDQRAVHPTESHGYAFPRQTLNGSEAPSNATSSGYYTPTYPPSSFSSRPSSAAAQRQSHRNGRQNFDNHQHRTNIQPNLCHPPFLPNVSRNPCCPDDLSACHDQQCSTSQDCSPFSQDYFPHTDVGQPYPLCNTPVAPCDTGCEAVSCMDQLAAAGTACHEAHCELPLCTTPDCEQQLPCVDPCLDFDCIEEACNQPQHSSACESQVCTTPGCAEPLCPPCTTCNLEQICPQCPPGHHPAAGHIHHPHTQQHQWQHCPPPAVCSDTPISQTAHCWDECHVDFSNNFNQQSHTHGDCNFDHGMTAKWPAMPTFQANGQHQHGIMGGQHGWSATQHCSKRHKHDNTHPCHGSHGHCDMNDLFGPHVYDTIAAQAHGMSSHFSTSSTPSIYGSDIFSDDPLTSLSNEATRRTSLSTRQKRKGVDGDIAYDEATNQHICRWALDGQTCSQPFSTPKELRDHIFEAHTARGKARDDSGGIVCRWNNCGRGSNTNTNGSGPDEHHTFRDGVKLEVHFCSHANYKKFTCQYCPDAFITKSQLDNHLKTHTGARPFLCPYPDCTSKVKAFATKTGLSTHVRSQHQKAKPFKCKFEGCVSEFADSSNRTKHHRDVHNAGNSMPCPAHGCEYRDTRAEGLRMHCKRVHAGDEAVVEMLGEDTRTPAWVRWVEEHKVARRKGSEVGANGGVAPANGKRKAVPKRKKGECAVGSGEKSRGDSVAQGGLPDLMPLVTAVNGMAGPG